MVGLERLGRLQRRLDTRGCQDREQRAPDYIQPLRPSVTHPRKQQ
jgi:hypothetical protein